MKIRGALMLLCLAGSVRAEVRLPNLISEHMVLQREVPVAIWGWADPHETVTVAFRTHLLRTTADQDSQWSVQLPPLKAGGPDALSIKGKNTITYSDVLVGEVWVCSGQSNMEMDVGTVMPEDAALARQSIPRIRLFDVPRHVACRPVNDVSAHWKLCEEENALRFSAVAFYFGYELLQEIDVPIGLIECSWGGTYIEPWTPRAGFEGIPGLEALSRQINRAEEEYQAALQRSIPETEAWLRAARRAQERGQALPPQPAAPVHALCERKHPTTLYNGMIHPLTRYPIRGVIWYQGEANIRDRMLYATKMRALIESWRAAWALGEFPFYYVQIAPFHYQEWEEFLPWLRHAQLAALEIPNTGMAITMDIGNLHTQHPLEKRAVGHRLALWALAQTYGHDERVYSGPLYESVSFDGPEAVVTFRHAETGLATRDGAAPSWLEVAGSDGKFVPAIGHIDGSRLIVSSPEVVAPVAVRYAWHQDALPTLISRAGLPASPFRTDE